MLVEVVAVLVATIGGQSLKCSTELFALPVALLVVLVSFDLGIVAPYVLGSYQTVVSRGRLLSFEIDLSSLVLVKLVLFNQ